MDTKLRLLEVNQRETEEKTFLFCDSLSLKRMSGNHLSIQPHFALFFIPYPSRGPRNTPREMTLPWDWKEDIRHLRSAAPTAMPLILRELSMPLASLSIRKGGFLLP